MIEREQGTGDERDRRGSGVRVSSFDPLSLPSDGVSSPFHPCPCFDSKESPPYSAARSASARARAPAMFLPSLASTPTRRSAWRATIAITSRSM